MRYQDAVDAGYDGPDPVTERRFRNRILRNNMLDCRDPDHDSRLCPVCNDELDSDDDETEE
jgi:hypothetical protein